MTNKVLKYGLFVFILGAIFAPQYYIPIIQNKGQVLQAASLQGAYQQTKKPNFWPKKWMTGTFQKSYESYIRDRNILTPLAVRLNTQLDFTLFNTIAHPNILLGQEGEFYTRSDCEAYVGEDFKGLDWITEKVRKLRFIIDHYQQKDISFVILIPAGKPGIIPERMPAYYQNYTRDSTNRIVFKNLLAKNQIPFLDFDFLKSIKDTSALALFGQASLHWSRFAYSTTADTLKNYITKEFGIKLPRFSRAPINDSELAFSDTDKELINSANFYKEPTPQLLPSPKLTFRADSITAPKILSIGDSYYLSFYKSGIHQGLFNPSSKFLYYNHEVYPPSTKNGKKVYAKDLDILAEIDQTELIILMVYESNLDRFGFNFIETVYQKIHEAKQEMRE
jgi:hypothetical protein